MERLYKIIMNFTEDIADFHADNNIKNQLRATITSYCIVNNIEVDTMQWDNLIHAIYEKIDNKMKISFDDFENDMCEWLV